MGLKLTEAFKDKAYFITSAGAEITGEAPTCTIYDEADNPAAGVVAELGNGRYECPFTPDNAGIWMTRWRLTAGGATYGEVHFFQAGQGQEADIDDFVDDLETRLTAARGGYLDELAAANLPTDVGNIETKVDTVDGFHDVPAQDSANNAQVRDVIGNKTDTTGGDSAIALLKTIDAKTTNLPTDPADDSDIDSQLSTIDGVLIATSGTADSGTATTLVDNALTQGDDYWNDMLIVITGGTNVGQARRISDFDDASDTVTVDPAFDAAIDGTSTYAIILDRQAAGGGGDATAANQTLILGDVGDASGATLGSLFGILGDPATTITADIATIDGSIIAVSGTADSGTATTLVDNALTQGDNYWNDMLLVITGGTNIGQARRISDFVAASDEITVDTAFNAAIDNTSVYAIILDRQAAGGGGDATAANQTLILGDVGDASGATLGSIFGILGDPATTITADISTVDAFHDVPAQDSADNVVMSDVLGNKTDTTGGDSAIALLKTIDAKTTNLPADPADDSDIDGQLSTIDGYVDKIDDGVDGLTAIKAEVEGIAGAAMRGTDSAATEAKQDVIDGFHDVPAQDSANNAQVRDVVGNKTDTTGGDSVVALLKTIDAKTTNLPGDPADDSDIDSQLSTIDAFHDVPAQDTGDNVVVSDVVGNKTDTVGGDSLIALLKQIIVDTGTDIVADFDRHVTWIDCWGDADNLVEITGGSTDVNLPDVIVPALPTGATIWKVVLLFKCAMIRDTSTSDNAINGAAAIRILKNGGAWGVDDIAAYDIADNSWAVDVSTSSDRGGDAFIGNMNNDNLSGEVDAAATYNLRFEDIQADGANLQLHDVAVGLRVYIY